METVEQIITRLKARTLETPSGSAIEKINYLDIECIGVKRISNPYGNDSFRWTITGNKGRNYKGITESDARAILTDMQTKSPSV